MRCTCLFACPYEICSFGPYLAVGTRDVPALFGLSGGSLFASLSSPAKKVFWAIWSGPTLADVQMLFGLSDGSFSASLPDPALWVALGHGYYAVRSGATFSVALTAPPKENALSRGHSFSHGHTGRSDFSDYPPFLCWQVC